MIGLRLLLLIILVIGINPQYSISQQVSNRPGSRKTKIKDFTNTWKWIERDWGWTLVPGIYKAYTSLFVDLDKKREAVLWEEEEFGLYKDLIKKSIKPGYFLIELTGYPVASFSAWMEEENNDAYEKFTIGGDFNLLKNLGSGKQEPISASIFLGQLATFWDLDENDDLIIAATGASGVVFTGGLHQLFDNSFLRSNWFRIEWKVKGSGGSKAKKRSWDLKIGFRSYDISEISNTFTLTIKRSRTERAKVDWRLFHNSKTSIEIEYPVDEINDGFSRINATYGKYFPIRGKLAGLEFGVVFENRREYDSVIDEFSTKKERQFEIFVTPAILF